MKSSKYQIDYSENSLAAKLNMYDEDGRHNKANKILAVLTDYLGGENQLKQISVLDMSCSTGMMAKVFSHKFCCVTGIDIDENAVDFAKKNNMANNIEFYVMDALHTEFSTAKFDVIINNQMYEHVPDPKLLMKEIYRLLVPGGVCYFGATNRFKIIETHYGRIPFLSYLPKSLANICLRILGRGDYYYETLYSYWMLKRIVKDFELVDYTRKVIKEPEKFHSTDVLTSHTFKHIIAIGMAHLAYPLVPGYIWLLKKPSILK